MSDFRLGILKSLFSLRVMSVVGGRILRWLIFPFPLLIILSLKIKILTLFICLFGGLLGYFLNNIFNYIFINLNFLKILLNIFFSFMWFIPLFSRNLINKNFLKLGFKYLKRFDYGWNELFGGLGILLVYKNLNYIFLKFHINYLKFIFSLVFILFILINLF